LDCMESSVPRFLLLKWTRPKRANWRACAAQKRKSTRRQRAWGGSLRAGTCRLPRSSNGCAVRKLPSLPFVRHSRGQPISPMRTSPKLERAGEAHPSLSIVPSRATMTGENVPLDLTGCNPTEVHPAPAAHLPVTAQYKIVPRVRV
jgi:hypothetical protein